MNLKEQFRNLYGTDPEITVRAPGRVNLIGEHTDYNEGFVFPAAIDRAMYIAARPSSDGNVRVHSMEYDDNDAFSVCSIEKTDRQWSNYLKGVLATLKQMGHPLMGFDAVISGDVPQGAGLSSSAAYEVAVAALANRLSDLKIDGRELAIISQRSENEFIGVQCGIMDQFISALAEPDSALLIDCRSLEYRPVKLNLEKHGIAIVITNSGVRRGLVDSEYNARRSECEEGTNLLGALLKRNVHSLRDIKLSELRQLESELPPTVAKRCRHVVSENERVLAAVAALESGDLKRFGQLMNDSHTSLRDDYQVSCPEVDRLVELTQAHQATCGARMTGAGFGGCTVALIKEDSVDDFVNNVVPQYEQQTKRKAEVYICKAGSGVAVGSN